MEDNKALPAWYQTCASYLRSFRNNRHTATDDSMPMDKRLTQATRRLFHQADPQERAVMTGKSDLPARQQAQTFNRLVYRLALLSGRTAAVIQINNDELKGD